MNRDEFIEKLQTFTCCHADYDTINCSDYGLSIVNEYLNDSEIHDLYYTYLLSSTYNCISIYYTKLLPIIETISNVTKPPKNMLISMLGNVEYNKLAKQLCDKYDYVFTSADINSILQTKHIYYCYQNLLVSKLLSFHNYASDICFLLFDNYKLDDDFDKFFMYPTFYTKTFYERLAKIMDKTDNENIIYRYQHVAMLFGDIEKMMPLLYVMLSKGIDCTSSYTFNTNAKFKYKGIKLNSDTIPKFEKSSVGNPMSNSINNYYTIFESKLNNKDKFVEYSQNEYTTYYNFADLPYELLKRCLVDTLGDCNYDNTIENLDCFKLILQLSNLKIDSDIFERLMYFCIEDAEKIYMVCEMLKENNYKLTKQDIQFSIQHMIQLSPIYVKQVYGKLDVELYDMCVQQCIDQVLPGYFRKFNPGPITGYTVQGFIHCAMYEKRTCPMASDKFWFNYEFENVGPKMYELLRLCKCTSISYKAVDTFLSQNNIVPDSACFAIISSKKKQDVLIKYEAIVPLNIILECTTLAKMKPLLTHFKKSYDQDIKELQILRQKNKPKTICVAEFI